MTPLGLLNFLVLQWFGVRLARIRHGPFRFSSTGLRLFDDRDYWIDDGYKLLRWIWPLTGWWSDYRWIARRP